MSFARHHDELQALMQRHAGEILTSAQIKSLFSKAYPALKVDWVSPSDHCGNHTCKGACHCALTEGAIFTRVGHGTYEVR